jgi:large subunit ribosomal protein L13
MIIDATDLIVGRMASRVAKLSLLGERIDIVNCEKAVITGNKTYILNKYKVRRQKGSPFKGVFLSRKPDFFIKRIIRGMLPYKQFKGKEAFKRIRCHISVPDDLKNNKLETIKEADVKKVPNLKYITIKHICSQLGAKQ